MLHVFEYPNTASIQVHIMKKKKEFDQLLTGAPLFVIKNITKNVSYNRENSVCQNTSILDQILGLDNDNNMNVIRDYKYRSCDPLLFEYDVIESSIETKDNKTFINNTLEQYTYNESKYNTIIQSLYNIGLENCELTNIMAGLCILPELNYIACASSTCFEESIGTTNTNLNYIH